MEWTIFIEGPILIRTLRTTSAGFDPNELLAYVQYDGMFLISESIVNVF